MIARLWWKEARQVGPIWAFLVGLGVFWMAAIQWYFNPAEVGVSLRLGGPALFVTFIYMFLIGAATFAGERENRTLGLLDALPVERWRAWVAKASFAAASTLALGALMMLLVAALEGLHRRPGDEMIVFLLVCGFGWSLFWSAFSGNALLAAALAIVSLGLTFAQLNMDGPILAVGLQSGGLRLWHWLFALALVPASALILHLGGPPRASWLGARRRPRRALVETTDGNISPRPLAAVRTGLVSRLVWQALREVWPIWWPLAVIGVGLPLAWAVSNSSNDPALWILGSLAVSLVAGANVFNAENRGGTQRFLAHHGARPGVVWLVKLAVGLATVTPIWLGSVWLTPSLKSPVGWGVTMPRAAGVFVGFHFAVFLIVAFLTSAFAAGAWCGMVFRRGITAGLVSLILWLVVCFPPLLLVSLGLVWPSHLLWISVAILAVTWAWSGDWLLDRPGFGRWARLGTYSGAALVALFSAYVAERVWSVPALPTAERERIFQFDRIGRFPTPPEENAADLYRLIEPNIGHPMIGPGREFRSLFVDGWGEGDPEAPNWLNDNKAILEELRRAAAMPGCRFHDLRKETVFSSFRFRGDPSPFQLAGPLVLSSRVRLAKGDLKGSWEDIETLFRMSRQFADLNSGPVRWEGVQVESATLSLAMLWAADPRQTAESLEAAQDAYRALPPPPSLADQYRADALIVNNTVDMPREELVRETMARESERDRKDPSPIIKLMIDVTTTPWELARAGRVFDLLAAARIQSAGANPTSVNFSPSFEAPLNPLVIGNGPFPTVISEAELLELAVTTPLARAAGSGVYGFNVALPRDNNIAPRRAFDVILSLLVQQARRGGKLPESLDELAAADPEVGPSLIDPYSKRGARFGYIPSQGQSLRPLGSFRSPQYPHQEALASMDRAYPTRDHMLLYSVGPDERDDRATTDLDHRNQGDIVFPLKDNSPPSK